MELNKTISELRRMALTAGILLTASSAPAQSLDEARTLAEDGNIADAITMLLQIEADEPKNAEIPQLLGDLYLGTGRDDDARQAYSEARRKGSRQAILSLAELANLNYRVDEARQLLEDYRKTLKKGKRTIATDESGDLPDRIDRTENMLDRVEQIEVIDSIVVDSEDFFSHFRLSAESGSINPPDVLPANFSAAHPTIVYEPESGRQMIWAAPDNEGVFKLMSSSLLYGDDWEKPAPLGDDLGEGGDANYPFLMPDGITLYFANDGENSLGGLDIFISRRNEDGFLQPQNIGMPYNSPYDDYMFAIDELTGVGWWATDRNRIPGKVTIYVFIPSELRKNVDPDNPDISRLARLSSIKDTWKPTTDRNEILRRIAAVKSGGHNIPKKQFEIFIPGRGIYTTLDDFRQPQARQAMQSYLTARQQVADAENKLAAMRSEYSRGNHDNAELIRQAEKQLSEAKGMLTGLRNTVISAEQ